MQPLEPGFVRIFNPETEGTAVVPESSLAQHYRAGWTRLDESPEPEPDPVPEPVRAPRGKKPPAASEDGGGTAGTDDSTGSEG